MADFTVRSDSVDVEQIMRQIRARIREKRGVDYTEAELKQLADVKLEKFLDPRGMRSDLVDAFRRHRIVSPEPPKFVFEDTTMYETHRGALRFIRKLLHPILKLFINPNPLIHAMHVQAQVNEEFHRRFRQREEMDPLFYEVIHNLVLEVTRLGIEVHNLKMRLESVSSRLDFDERRSRALESVVEYRPHQPPRQARANPPVHQPAPSAATPAPAPAGVPGGETAGMTPPGGRPEPVSAMPGQGRPDGPRPDGSQGPGGGERRRRRRRRRRRPGHTMADRQMGQPGSTAGPAAGGAESGSAPEAAPGHHAPFEEDDSGVDTHDDHDEAPDQ